MYILGVWGEIRELCLRFDMVSFSFIDNVYDLFEKIATLDLLTTESVKNIVNNFYVVVCLFAFFRIAVLLINSIINPDALNQKGAGLSKTFTNLVIMIILLIITPQLFSMSRELTSEIVNGNYIQKLILDTNDIGYEPGYDMQRIAISAIIVPEDKYVTDMNNLSINEDNCSGECENAIKCLQEIKGGLGVDVGTECTTDNGNVKWSKLVEYNGVQTGIIGSRVYVYNYKPLILTVLGWTITYILLSFAFDAGKRLIELAILEILSPLFIATIVDPKSMKSGPFNKWLKAVGTSYASLFLRIAAVAIIILCVRLLMAWENIGAFTTLIVMLSVLIFAKGFPKWISNMIGISGDGTGLGSLGIGKKLAGAALIGGSLTKAGHAAVGSATGAIRTAHATRKAKKTGLGNEKERAHNRLKAAYNSNRDEHGKVGSAAKALGQTYFKKEGIKKNLENFGKTAQAGGLGAAQGIVKGAKLGWQAGDLKDVNAKVKADAKGTFNKLAPDYQSLASKAGANISRWHSNKIQNVIGDDFSLDERKNAVEKDKKALERYGTIEKTSGGKRSSKLNPVNAKEVNELVNSYKSLGINASSSEDISKALVQARIDAGIIDGSKVKVTSGGISINGAKEIKATDFCKQEKIYNPYGQKEFEAIAKENAYTKASEYVKNQSQIGDANKTAAIANQQLISIQANVKATLGDEALNELRKLDSTIGERTKLINKLEELKNSIPATEEEAKKRNEGINNTNKLLDTCEKYIQNAKIEVDKKIGIGTADSYEAASSTREESISVARKLESYNEEIRKEVEKYQAMMEADPKSENNYIVKDVTTGVEYKFLSDPTKNEYVVNLLAKAKDSAKEDASKLKPKDDK